VRERKEKKNERKRQGEELMRHALKWGKKKEGDSLRLSELIPRSRLFVKTIFLLTLKKEKKKKRRAGQIVKPRNN